MKIFSFLFILLVAFACQQPDTKDTTKFIEIQWMPLTADQGYLNEVMAAADSFNVSGFQLSHQLIHTIDEIVYPERTRDMITYDVNLDLLNNFINQSREKEYGLHVWTHEIVSPPEHTVKDNMVIIDHPDLKTYLQHKYDTALQIVPSIDSYILTLFETEYRVYKEGQATTIKADDTPHNRAKILINTMWEVASENGVNLVVRGFEGSDKVFPDLDPQIILMKKNTETDWHPFAPFNDFITQNSGKKKLWVEFDLGYEYEMRNTVVYGEPVDLLVRIKKSYQNGVRVFPIRLDRYGGDKGASAIHTPWGQLGLMMFSRFAVDTTITATEVINDWENKHFKGAYELMQLSTDVTQTLLFPKKMWYANHSGPPDYDYARRHILPDDGYGTAQKWADNTNVSNIEAQEFLKNSRKSNQPDQEWYQSILDDLSSIKPKVQRIDEIIQENQSSVNENPIWGKAVERLKVWVPVYSLNQEIYFGLRLYQQDTSAIEKEHLWQLIDQYEKSAQEVRQKIGHQPSAQVGAMLWRFDDSLKSFKEQLSNTPGT